MTTERTKTDGIMLFMATFEELFAEAHVALADAKIGTHAGHTFKDCPTPRCAVLRKNSDEWKKYISDEPDMSFTPRGVTLHIPWSEIQKYRTEEKP